jgi:hypothetical protein
MGLGIADLVQSESVGRIMSQLKSGEFKPNSRLTLPPLPQRSYAYLSDTAFDRPDWQNR